MNIQRLKFAWARGARLQVLTFGDWCLGSMEEFLEGGYTPDLIRIHPDDAHLEYGPLSRALRDTALYLEDQEEGEDFLMDQFLDLSGTAHFTDTWGADSVTADFCRLFWAEFWADEGM
jgi:hypothetical protein